MADLKRVFSVGYKFDDDRVWSTEFHEPDSSLGHDLIYWDPTSLVDGYGASVTDTTSFIDGMSARAFERDRQRRGYEFREHLNAGKPIVIAIPAPKSIVVSLTVPAGSIERNFQLVDPLFLQRQDLDMRTARGKAFERIADRAFVNFWRLIKDGSRYEGYFAHPPGVPLLRISGTNKVVAAAVSVGAGVVLYLPRLMLRSAHKDFLDLLWSVCEEFKARSLGGPPVLPKWTDEIHIPGESEAHHARKLAQRRLTAAQRAVEEQNERIADLQERKLLVSGTGEALEKVVEEAFSALDFDVEPGCPGRTDRVVRWKQHIAVVEIKGKSKSASERDAAQLEKWKSDFHATYGILPKGILVVNAWSQKPLEERDKLAAFPEQMLAYAARQRQQCLLTGIQLLGLWLAAEARPEDIDKLARSIVTCDGIYPD